MSAKKARLDLAELRQAQAKEEEEEEKELRSRLLETQPALRTLYECLVRNAQEGESPSSSGPFVSEADFWKLEGAALLPLKSQTARKLGQPPPAARQARAAARSVCLYVCWFVGLCF